MKLYSIYYHDIEGNEQCEVVAAHTRPTIEEAIAHLRCEVGVLGKDPMVDIDETDVSITVK